MDTITLLLIALLLIAILNLLFTLKSGKSGSGAVPGKLHTSQINLSAQFKDTEQSIKGEFVTNRNENQGLSTRLRDKLGNLTIGGNPEMNLGLFGSFGG
jgi:hypothetical protein